MTPSRGTVTLSEMAAQPRARRAADVTTVVVGGLLLGWGLVIHGAADPFEQALSQFAAALPEWAVGVLVLTYTLGLLYAVGVLVMLVGRRRWDAVRDVVLAAGLAAVVTLVLVAVFDHLWPPFLAELVQAPVEMQFPVVRVAVVTAVLVASSPSLSRPIRRLGWLLVVLVGGAAVAMALSTPSGVVAGLGAGLLSAGSVLLLFGSPRGYPDAAEVGAALERVGVAVPDLRIARDQSWGVRRMVGTTAMGTDVEVKAYGRDAMDSQVMAKAWHAVAYRGGGQAITLSRVQAVEHEALVTLLAREAGMRVPDVLAAAGATEEVAVLVTDRPGRPLADVQDPRALDHTNLTSLWRQLAALHDGGITHGGLTTRAVRWTGDGFVFCEFAAGSVVFREPDAALDVVHLLVATASIVGPERAAAAAVEGLGRDRLAACLGYLQPPALTGRERRSVPGAAKLLKSMREQVVAVTGTEVPEPVKLRRVGVRDIATAVVILLFLGALVPLLLGIDYAEIWTALRDAIWWLTALAILAGQVAFLPQGVAMMCAVGRRIPLRPMTLLQPAAAFISFAVPGMVGRVTMISAFLYKYGVPPTAAVTKGAVDSFAGFLVQVALLLTAVLTGAVVLSPPADSVRGSGVSWWVIAVVVGLAAATVVSVLKIPRLRDRIVPQISKAWGALTDVLRSPRLALGLVGSQLVVQLLWGLALWLALLALGTHLSLISCTAVVVATMVLQGIVPVPGGVGVSEAVMSAFLVPLGVPTDAAMGAAVIWRVATFYLPATEGFFAAKYLQRHGYL